jgi:hypothetical protein
MYLIYVDEAGNTGLNLSDPEQPFHVVVGLLVPDGVWRDVETAMAAIVDKHVPPGEKAGFEFHAFELHHGKGFFKGWPHKSRLAIADEVLSVLDQHSLDVIYGACHKPEHAKRYAHPMHPHDLAFLLAAERCERYLSQAPEQPLGLFIADRNMEVEGQVRASLRDYRLKGIPLGKLDERLDHIIEDIHFQSSQASCFLQLADFCAYYIKRALTAGNWGDPRAGRVSKRIRDCRVLP